jgi:DNA repair protein RecN (Recombination protein N)
MLQRLKIENYALIQLMDIQFSEGFYSITGETGSGKSIMLGALNLVLGSRADTSVLWDKEKKCVVEAWFTIPSSLKGLFDKFDLDYAKESVFHREINPSGKSRAFVNDTPVSLVQMKEIASHLVDIHSQHSTLTLQESDFQFSILDFYMDNEDLMPSYSTVFQQWRGVCERLAALEEQKAQGEKEKSYYEFLFQELEKLNLKEGEQKQEEQEVEMLSNAQEIKSSLFTVSNILDNESDEGGVISLLNSALQQLDGVREHYEVLKTLDDRLSSCLIELKDILSEVVKTNENISLDDEKLQSLKERLDEIYAMEKKHGVNSLEDLLSVKAEIGDRLLQSSNIDSQINSLKAQEKTLGEKTKSLALLLSKERQKNAQKIQKDIAPLLADLGMKEAELKIEVKEARDFSAKGKDEVSFLFNANRGGELQRLGKVISGGELSRLMLALKAIIGKRKDLPTMIFDEIDSGVSGNTAAKVAQIMYSLSIGHQVIAITHLPQIAAKATGQFQVFKSEKGNMTTTQMRPLTQEERIKEIASMISNGGLPSQSALANAQELLS